MSWLARLKNLETPERHATKPTEPGCVGYVAPCPGILENSYMAEVPLRLLLAGPANVAPAIDHHHVDAGRTCADCLHLTRAKTCGETEAAGLDLPSRFSIWWPPEGYAADCRAFTAKVPAPAQDRPHRLTNDEGDRCHAPCWDDAEMAAFTARAERFALLGRADADDLAERLTLRDRQHDERRLCLECTWLGDTGRCLAAATGRIPGADRRLEPVQTILHCCAAFGLRKGLT